ncbi:receptor-like protein EIX1 [Carex rostrata]
MDGSIIYDLASVPSLRTLDLSYNFINNSKGFESWSNLTKLQMLDLSDNFPPISIFSSLAKVSSLRALYLDDIYMMEGSIDVAVKELSALKLEVLSLSRCTFYGSFPYLGNWSTSLKALALTHNGLNGTLTSQGLCRLENLQELDLSRNMLT